MGNELSGVLRQDDLEVSVKLMIKKRKDGQQIHVHKPQQQQQQQQQSQLQQQQQDNSSIPSDDSEEDEDEGEDEEDEEFEGDEVDPEDEEEEEDEGTEDAKTLVDELLQGEGEGKSGAAVTPAAAAAGLSKKRRGRPPKSAAAAASGEKAGASADEESPAARKRRKVGAGRPSSVKMRSNSANPILDICIAKTHLCPSYCLNVPPEFSNAYLEADKEYEVVDGGASCKTLGLCLKNKRCVVKRSHWKLFVDEHKLKCGDTVHLELLPSGDQIRIQVSKCDETLDLSQDQEQKSLGQNGHAAAAAVAPVDLEKQLMAAAEVPAVEAPAAEVPVAEVPADVSAADPEIQ